MVLHSKLNTKILRPTQLRYFRHGYFNSIQRFLAILHYSIPYRINAKKLSVLFGAQYLSSNFGEKNIVSIKNYDGQNKQVLKIASYLKENINDLILGAYVHGSTGSLEEISYSDFDGLIIIRNETYDNPKLLRKLALALLKSENYFYKIDPLQHHGWFILNQNDLSNYPYDYFPIELFHYAKCLVGENNLRIYLNHPAHQIDGLSSFQHLTESILKKIKTQSFLKNQYVFKNFLSEFMLLPAVFLQARDSKGIFKKFSFEILKSDYPECCHIMDEISLMRQEWVYTPSFARRLYLGSKPYLNAWLPNDLFSGSIPAPIKNKFNKTMILRMRDFVIFLTKKINEANTI